MNKFNIITKLDSDEPSKINILLQPAVAEHWINVLKEHYAVAMLEGTHENFPDGCVQLSFQIPSDEAALLRNALMQAYTKHSGFNTSN